MAMTPSPSPSRRDQERRMFSASDDPTMLKHIEATHAPDARDNVDAMPILDIIEDIFLSLDHAKLGSKQKQALKDKTTEAVIDASGVLEDLAHVIQKVSCEISYKNSGGEDAHLTAMSVLHTLSRYSWDAKVVIAMAALATTYGEFWLFVQFYAMHPVAKSVAVLKQLGDLIEHSDTLKSQFDNLNNLINVMLDVTKMIVELRHLLRRSTFTEQSPLSTAMTHIPTAVYWTIRSVVVCATHIASLIGTSYWRLTQTIKAWELSSLAHKERNIHNHLTQQLNLCYQHVDEKRVNTIYNTLRHILEASHVDNTRFLKHLIYLKDDIQPLVNGSTKARVHVEALKRKTVMLLISDFDRISYEELAVLKYMYTESRERAELQYEIVWLPIVDKSAPWTEAQQARFEQLQSVMPWYTLHNPKLLELAAVRYIKEVWRFSKKTITVVLDPQGKVTCRDAIHMMWIWGNLAYPFSAAKEEALWRKETWRLELVVDDIDTRIHEWKAQGKIICLYGGENLEWIREFTKTARSVAAAAGVELELVYVGKAKGTKMKIRRIIECIRREELSHYLFDLSSMWYFWARLECMIYSKMQHSKNVENDSIMSELMRMLSFDGHGYAWAAFWFGSTDTVQCDEGCILGCLSEFETWKQNAKDQGFVPALRELLQQHYGFHCNRLILDSNDDDEGIPKRLVCAMCGMEMEKYSVFVCCRDD